MSTTTEPGPEALPDAPKDGTPDNAAGDILIRKDGRAGRITLNRPKALNALTLDMVRAIQRALDDWRSDATVQLVVLDGAGDKGLCAGGDVKTLYASRATDGNAFARMFWAEEYRLNADIARYPKPYVALMDGTVMGGGVGLSAHANRRIVTEHSQIAMPETAIGLIPDVGGIWLLAHAPGALGVYLGLTGQPMGAADAIHAGFADQMVPRGKLAQFTDALCNPYGLAVDRVIAGYAAPADESELAARQAGIDSIFSADRVETIIAQLQGSGEDWARAALASLAGRSPLSLKLTLAAIAQARRHSSLEETLNLEYRLTTRLFDRGEFIEGIRALIIDKDRKPIWNPATLEQLTVPALGAFLAPMLPGEELGLSAPTA